MVARTNRAECAIALRQAAPALGLILLSDTRLRANAPLRTLAASLPNSRLLSGSLTATDLAEVIAQAPTATGGV